MFPSCCLVSVDGVNECVSNDCAKFWKNEYFPWHHCWGHWVQFGAKFMSYWLVLVILWLKVVKNYGVVEICVLLGRIFGISLAQGSEETWRF